MFWMNSHISSKDLESSYSKSFFNTCLQYAIQYWYIQIEQGRFRLTTTTHQVG